MIATLTGMIAEKNVEQVVLETGGVGYGVYVTSEDHGGLPVGQKAKLYIYEHVRENSYDLFGFKKPETKKLFEQLLSVNGIGPKMAINVLSIGNVDAVRQAIASGDIKYVQAAPGVGRRVAERLIVDLKDKVGLESVDLGSTGILQSDAYQKQDEAVEALISLGYSLADAVKSLKNVDKELSTGERVKLALKNGRQL